MTGVQTCALPIYREGAVKEAKILEESMEVNTMIIVKIALL